MTSTPERLARFARLPTLSGHLDILPAGQRALWDRLGAIPDDFVLYGGTALALHLGHRESLDFDFFSASGFEPSELLRQLRHLGRPEEIRRMAADNLAMVVDGVQLSFFGGLDLQAVAEPSLASDNGLVVASVFDLGGTKLKAILDRSEWKDYADIGALLDHRHALADLIGYATTVFERQFPFPTAVLLQSLVWFEDGTAPDVPKALRRQLEAAVRNLRLADIPAVDPYRTTIAP